MLPAARTARLCMKCQSHVMSHTEALLTLRGPNPDFIYDFFGYMSHWFHFLGEQREN